MMNKIINDFKSVREQLGYYFGREIPLWIAILYYVIVGALVLPFLPFLRVWLNRKIKKMFEEDEA